MTEIDPPRHHMHLSDFEQGRRESETRNERVIHIVLAVSALIGVIALSLGPMLVETVVPPPQSMVVINGVGFLVFCAILVGLHWIKGYVWWRKYLLTGVDLAFFLAVTHAEGELGHPELALLMPVAASMLAIILAGLRYSAGAVLLAGGGALIAHFVRTVPSDLDVRMPIMAGGAFYLTLATVIVAYVVYSLIHLHRQSVHKERLGRFFAPQVLEEVERAPALTLEAVEREVTVVFVDISDFTRMSSQMSPKEIVHLLNDYFTVMGDTVFEHGGTLEKYIGDALLAVWGAPIASNRSADQAVAAALGMLKCVEKLNQQWREEGRPTIRIHIGVHTGPVAAGNIGTEQYIQYACIGDTTNTASRVCSAAASGEVLISQTTKEQLSRSDFELHPLPPTVLKGKEGEAQLYRVVP